MYIRRREYLVLRRVGDLTADVTTQNLFWLSHRESNLLRRSFQRQPIRVPGLKPAFCASKIFMSSLRRRCSLRYRRLLRGVASRWCSGDRTDIVGERIQRHQLPPSPAESSLDLQACESVNFQFVKPGDVVSRAFGILHVRPSVVGVGAGDSASSLATVALIRTVTLVARRRIRPNE